MNRKMTVAEHRRRVSRAVEAAVGFEAALAPAKGLREHLRGLHFTKDGDLCRVNGLPVMQEDLGNLWAFFQGLLDLAERRKVAFEGVGESLDYVIKVNHHYRVRSRNLSRTLKKKAKKAKENSP